MVSQKGKSLQYSQAQPPNPRLPCPGAGSGPLAAAGRGWGGIGGGVGVWSLEGSRLGEQGGHGTMDGSPEAINCLGQEMVKEICHPGGPGNIPKSPATPGGREGWSPLTRSREGD